MGKTILNIGILYCIDKKGLYVTILPMWSSLHHTTCDRRVQYTRNYVHNSCNFTEMWAPCRWPSAPEWPTCNQFKEWEMRQVDAQLDAWAPNGRAQVFIWLCCVDQISRVLTVGRVAGDQGKPFGPTATVGTANIEGFSSDPVLRIWMTY